MSIVYCLAVTQIKSNLHYTRGITPKRNEWRGPSPRQGVCTTQLRRNIAAVASRWRHCADSHANTTVEFVNSILIYRRQTSEDPRPQ